MHIVCAYWAFRKFVCQKFKGYQICRNVLLTKWSNTTMDGVSSSLRNERFKAIHSSETSRLP